MKKIATVTFHRAHNYGAVLQAYALEKNINKKYNAEILDYYDEKIFDQYKTIRFSGKNFFVFAKRLVKDILNFRIINQKRYNNFNLFIKSSLKLSNKYTYKNIKGLAKDNYNVLITGSDQVWNPDIVGELSDIYTLNFGDAKIKRISYAASIGNSRIEEKYKEEYKKKISKIDYISVREEDGKKALEEIIDKPIEVVLDPTLLLTQEEWDKEIQECTNEKEKYILAYVVEENEEYRKIVNYLSEKTGLKIIHFEKRNKYKNILRSAYTDGPLEFVNLIKNAEYVIATSFHATVFSIIFHKKFFIVPHKKTGSRVTNLLEKLGIKNRTAYTLEDFEKIDYNFETDWNPVEEKLEQERKKSITWLDKAIEG